jgi:hypothetical protein
MSSIISDKTDFYKLFEPKCLILANFGRMDSFDSFYKGKRVLVTGHTGFKGSWLSIWLHELGAEVVGVGLDPLSDRDNFVLSGIGGKMAAGYAPTMIVVFFMGGLLLAFLGFLGEYVMAINARVMNRSLVVEEERINFTD